MSLLARNNSESSADSTGSRGDPAEFAVLWRPTEGEAARQGPERLLMETGQVTAEQIEQAEAKRKANPRLSVLDILVQTKVIDATQALQAVAMYFKLPFLRVTAEDVDERTFSMLPSAYCKAKRVLPIRKSEHGVVVALTDPADIFLIDDIKRRIDGPIKLAVAPPADIQKTIEDLSANPTDRVDEIIKGISEDAVEVVDTPTEDVADLENARRREPGHPLRELPDLLGRARGRQRHSHRAGRESPAYPVPHRRHPVRPDRPAGEACTRRSSRV